MSPSVLHATQPQFSQTLLIIADFPEKENAEEVDQALNSRVNEALLSLARAAFARGWQITLSGQPALGLLLSMVGGEYLSARSAEGGTDSQQRELRSPLVYYRTLDMEEHYARSFDLLEKSGYVTLIHAEELSLNRLIRDRRPAGLVMIGDKSKFWQVLETFQSIRRGAPIYVIGSTIDDAHFLTLDENRNIRVFDQEVLDMLERHGYSQTNDTFSLKAERSSLPPYAVIMQRLIQDLSENRPQE